MLVRKLFLPALLFTALTCSAKAMPASSAPANLIQNAAANQDIIEVKNKKKVQRHHRATRHRDVRRHHNARRYYGNRYRPGYRYRSAPRGWHGYYSRPAYWRTRGCVIVGPLWFCP